MTEESLKIVILTLSIVGTVSGLFGTGLSVYNAWRQADREKVKLSLRWTFEPWGGGLGLAVIVHSLKIENRSPFAVTIADAGVVFEEADTPQVTFSQTVTDGNGDTETRSLPLRLESRDSMTLTSDSDTTDSDFQKRNAQYVYVRTGDGTVTKCSEPNDKAPRLT